MGLFRCPALRGAADTRRPRRSRPKRHSLTSRLRATPIFCRPPRCTPKSPATAGRWWRPAAGFWIPRQVLLFRRLNGIRSLAYGAAGSLIGRHAGCGEGYHTARLVQALRASGKTPSAAAFDISKFAVKVAARRDKGHAVQWAVASSFAIPCGRCGGGLPVDIFSPAAAQEFARVVKPGGAFVFAVPSRACTAWEVLYERPPPRCRMSLIPALRWSRGYPYTACSP